MYAGRICFGAGTSCVLAAHVVAGISPATAIVYCPWTVAKSNATPWLLHPLGPGRGDPGVAASVAHVRHGAPTYTSDHAGPTAPTAPEGTMAT